MEGRDGRQGSVPSVPGAGTWPTDSRVPERLRQARRTDPESSFSPACVPNTLYDKQSAPLLSDYLTLQVLNAFIISMLRI